MLVPGRPVAADEERSLGPRRVHRMSDCPAATRHRCSRGGQPYPTDAALLRGRFSRHSAVLRGPSAYVPGGHQDRVWRAQLGCVKPGDGDTADRTDGALFSGGRWVRRLKSVVSLAAVRFNLVRPVDLGDVVNHQATPGQRDQNLGRQQRVPPSKLAKVKLREQ